MKFGLASRVSIRGIIAGALVIIALALVPSMSDVNAQTIVDIADGQEIPYAGYAEGSGEVGIERAPDCEYNPWYGIQWCALLPAVQGGDVVPRADVNFSLQAIQNGQYVIMYGCEDIARRPDKCWTGWRIKLNEAYQPGKWYRFTAKDGNFCQATRDNHRYYTKARAYAFDDQSYPRESGNIRVERLCRQ